MSAFSECFLLHFFLYLCGPSMDLLIPVFSYKLNTPICWSCSITFYSFGIIHTITTIGRVHVSLPTFFNIKIFTEHVLIHTISILQLRKKWLYKRSQCNIAFLNYVVLCRKKYNGKGRHRSAIDSRHQVLCLLWKAENMEIVVHGFSISEFEPANF